MGKKIKEGTNNTLFHILTTEFSGCCFRAYCLSPRSCTVKNNLFIGNFYVFFPCRIYLKTLVLPLTH